MFPLNANRVKQRKVDELIGICSGIVADGVVNQDEAKFLASWLEANREATACFPGDVLVDRLHDMLVDGVLDAEESAELLQTLRSSCGLAGTLEVPAPAAPQLFDTTPPPVVFPGKSFVVTGIFAFGPRKACEEAINARGGIIERRVTANTDYVVIGSAASPDWKHASYGTKIEQALQHKEAGRPIAIISEDHWAEAVVAMPEAAAPPTSSEAPLPAKRLEGKRVLFTGTLDGLSRSTAQAWVEALGGNVIFSVCKRLDYIVCGAEPGTKLEKARSLGITMLDQEAFLRLVGRDATDVRGAQEKQEQEDCFFEKRGDAASQPENDAPDQPLEIREIPGIAGKHFTFSGLTRGIKRDMAEKLVRQAGGIVEYTVTKSRTDYVVTDYAGGSEVNKAPKWGKPIIGGKELLEMLKGKP